MYSEKVLPYILFNLIVALSYFYLPSKLRMYPETI